MKCDNYLSIILLFVDYLSIGLPGGWLRNLLSYLKVETVEDSTITIGEAVDLIPLALFMIRELS